MTTETIKKSNLSTSEFLNLILSNPDIGIIAIFDNRYKSYQIKENEFGRNPKKTSDQFIGMISVETFSFCFYHNMLKNTFDYNSNARQSYYNLYPKFKAKKSLLTLAQSFDLANPKTKAQMLSEIYKNFKAL